MKWGSRVHLKDGSPRNVGTVKAIVHKRIGVQVSVKWDCGWWSTFEQGDLVEVGDELREAFRFQMLLRG